MDIYKEYLSAISDAMKPHSVGQTIGSIQKAHNDFNGQANRFDFAELNRRVPKAKLQPGLELFAKELGLRPNFEQQLGLHPDFAYLKNTDAVESHYIVSMFVDIKGSTNLFRRYRPETVVIITNTIQRAAIHTCVVLGGYVHRLQGDGLFLYFGGKSVDNGTAVERALTFASVFTYFVKTDLKKLFDEQGIESIFTRIGVDLGYDEDVLWSMAGIGEISEVTTCSLHTSLASKMQAQAESNGIVVGDNIVSEFKIAASLFTPVSNRTKYESDRYIYRIPERNFYYTQYDFSWLKWLKNQSYVATDMSGNLHLKQTPVPNINTKALQTVAAVNRPYLDK